MKTSRCTKLMFVLSTTAILSACHMPGITKDPESASFKVDPINAPVMGTYEQLDDVTFQKATIFLWKGDTTPANVKTVQRLSKELDISDEMSGELKKQENDLNRNFAPDLQKEKETNTALLKKKSEITKKSKEKSDELKKPEPNQDKEKLKKIEEDLVKFNAEKVTLETELANVKTRLIPYKESFEKITKDQEEVSKMAQDKLKELENIISMYPEIGSTELVFRRGVDGNPEIQVTAWKLSENEAAKSFSTESGNIINAKFTPRGGVYEFEVIDGLTTYYFKVSRFKPENPMGLIIFTGDLEKREYDQSGKLLTLTRGGAKFIDKNNSE